MLSKQNQIIIEAKKRGYKITIDGVAIGLNNNKLKLSINSKGYYSFNMRFGDKNKPTRVFIHKLQAYQKFGNKLFKDNIQVRHLNGVSLDNSFSNIEIGSPSDNTLDISKEIRIEKSNKGWIKANPRSKTERFEIYELLKNNISFREINRKLGVSKSTLSYIKNKSKEYKKYLNKTN